MKYIKNTLFFVISLIFACNAISGHAFADNVDNFYFKKFDASYYLSTDKDGHSVMNVTEKLDAIFPNYNQNKGIVRYIPNSYDGHSVNLKFSYLTRNGNPEPIYKEYVSGNYNVIETGTDGYLQGEQLYTISYSLKDVVGSFNGRQELYWDTNGTGWSQTFGSVSATVYIDNKLIKNLSNNFSCYQGTYGSKEKCNVEIGNNYKSIVFSSTRTINKNENITFDIQFNKNVFQNYKYTIFDYIKNALRCIALLLGIVCLIICIFFINKYAKNKKNNRAIIPQYIENSKVPIMISGDIYSVVLQKVFVAQIIKLAVNKKIKIVEKNNENSFIKNKNYSLILCDISNLDEYDLKVIDILFPSRTIGDIYSFKKYDSKLLNSISSTYNQAHMESVENNYRLNNKKFGALFYIMLIIGCFCLSYSFTSQTNSIGNTMTSAFLLFIVLTVFFYCFGSNGKFISTDFKPLTSNGAVEYDYLSGLKLYINMAEKDRLSYLQSPNNAEKIIINDKQQIIYLYERLLPYAVLFNLEKQWIKQLSIYYENNNNNFPAWYVGTAAFDANNFISSMNSFSNFVSNSSMASQSSGANGGGFSGGGGGGGGGGGR